MKNLSRELFIVVCIIVLLAGSYACAPKENAAETTGQESHGKAPVPNPPATSAAGGVPSTVAGGAVTGVGSKVEGDLSSFLEGVVTGNEEMFKAGSIAGPALDFKKATDDLGFREFAAEGDYAALWNKIKPLGNFTYTTVSDTEMIVIWLVNGKAEGLKDLQAQFDMKLADGKWKVAGYNVAGQ
jgi:hypothetical protein